MLSSIWYDSTEYHMENKSQQQQRLSAEPGTHIKATDYLFREQRHHNFHKERERSFSEYFLQDWKITMQNVCFCNKQVQHFNSVHFHWNARLAQIETWDCLICFTLLLRAVCYTISLYVNVCSRIQETNFLWINATHNNCFQAWICKIKLFGLNLEWGAPKSWSLVKYSDLIPIGAG